MLGSGWVTPWHRPGLQYISFSGDSPTLPPQQILGPALKGYWDAMRTDLITQSGGGVTSWKDIIAGYDAVQAVSAARPIYTATGFNAAPALSFDGTDDELTLPSVPFPVGASPCNIYALVDQQASPGDGVSKRIVTYGRANAVSRYPQRFVSGGVNRFQFAVGNGSITPVSSQTTIDFTGRHVAFGQIVTGGNLNTAVDGVAGSVGNSVATTATDRTVVGASAADFRTNFWQGLIAAILITDGSETQGQIDQVTNYLKTRGAIV